MGATPFYAMFKDGTYTAIAACLLAALVIGTAYFGLRFYRLGWAKRPAKVVFPGDEVTLVRPIRADLVPTKILFQGQPAPAGEPYVRLTESGLVSPRGKPICLGESAQVKLGDLDRWLRENYNRRQGPDD